MSGIDVFNAYVRQCNLSGNPPAQLTVLRFYVIMPIFIIGFLFIVCVMPATYRLAQTHSGYLIILHYNIVIALWCIQSIWLFGEFYIGSSLDPPFVPEGLIYRGVNFGIPCLLSLLALNRVIAILMPINYKILFSIRKTKIYIAICWALSIVYTAFVAWPIIMRPTHCLSRLIFTEPTAFNLGYPAQTAVVLALANPVAIPPFFLYGFGLIKICYDVILKRTTQTTEENHQRNSVDNTSKECRRLFFICFLTTFPSLSQQAASWTNQFLNPMGDAQFGAYVVFWAQISVSYFRLQEPFFLLLLSKVFRAEVAKNYKFLKCTECPLKTNTRVSQNPTTNLNQLMTARSGTNGNFSSSIRSTQCCIRNVNVH